MANNSRAELLTLFPQTNFTADGPSLLGLSHISNVSMNVNETAMTSTTMSCVETADPIDTFDATICPVDDLLDGCKVSLVLHNSPIEYLHFKYFVWKMNLLRYLFIFL